MRRTIHTGAGDPADQSPVRGRAELTDEFLTDSATPFDRGSIEKILDKLAKRLDAANV